MKKRGKRGKGKKAKRGKKLGVLLPPIFPARLKAIRAPKTLWNNQDML
jgi:hypothetical protein